MHGCGSADCTHSRLLPDLMPVRAVWLRARVFVLYLPAYRGAALTPNLRESRWRRRVFLSQNGIDGSSLVAAFAYRRGGNIIMTGGMFFVGMMVVTAVISTIFAIYELPVVLTDKTKK